MNDAWPAESVTPLPDGGVRYRLPHHGRRRRRIAGVLMALGGAGLGGLAGFFPAHVLAEPGLAPHLSYDRLWHLAHDLADRVAALRSDPTPVRVDEEWTGWQDVRPTQPAYSRVRVSGGPGTVRFDLPAAGFFSLWGAMLAC